MPGRPNSADIHQPGKCQPRREGGVCVLWSITALLDLLILLLPGDEGSQLFGAGRDVPKESSDQRVQSYSCVVDVVDVDGDKPVVVLRD